MEGVDFAKMVGTEVIGGVTCTHLLFGRPDVGIQIWIPKEGPPLPAKYVVTDYGTGWTLVYPRFSVAVPFPDRWGAPLAFAMPIPATRLHAYVDAWIEMAKGDGTVDRYFDPGCPHGS